MTKNIPKQRKVKRMATSDEVWARGCPPHGRDVHVLAGDVAEFAIVDLIQNRGFSVTVRARGDDEDAFAQELRSLEKCSIVVVDLETFGDIEAGFSLGYACARGKTLIAYASPAYDISKRFRIDCAAYRVDDSEELRQVMAGLARAGSAASPKQSSE